MTERYFVYVQPLTLSRQHIFDGEEVVTGDDDGQAWVATFATATDADWFIAKVRLDERRVIGERRAADSAGAVQK